MNQEKYVACKCSYDLYAEPGKGMEGLGYLVASHSYDSTRIECIYKLVVFYCCKGQYHIAYMYYTLIQNFFENNYTPEHISNKLFADKNDYEFYLPYYMIIVGEKTSHKDVCAKMCKMIAKYKCEHVSEFHIGNWIYNMQFFFDFIEIDASFRKDFAEYLDILYKKGFVLPTVRPIIERIQTANIPTNTHANTYIVNLERRKDRKEAMKVLMEKEGIRDYEFYKAIDGRDLTMTDELNKLFAANNFNFRRGVIGCALSHIQLWKKLVQDAHNEYYVILEDDITVCDDFKTQLDSHKTSVFTNIPQYDVLFLGHHVIAKKSNERFVCSSNKRQPMDRSACIGGTFGYIVPKHGAKKMLDYIETNGIRYAIDGFMRLTPELNIWNAQPHIVYSDWIGINENMDTDIQRDYECVANCS